MSGRTGSGAAQKALGVDLVVSTISLPAAGDYFHRIRADGEAGDRRSGGHSGERLLPPVPFWKNGTCCYGCARSKRMFRTRPCPSVNPVIVPASLRVKYSVVPPASNSSHVIGRSVAGS